MIDEPEGSYRDEPAFVISIAARITRMHAQTLRSWERAGLVAPSRSRGNIRLYSQRDIERVRQIQRLMNDLGLNLAGVEILLRLQERLAALEEENRRLHAELQRFRDRRLPAPPGEAPPTTRGRPPKGRP